MEIPSPTASFVRTKPRCKILIGPATLNGLPVKMQVWYIKRRMDLLLFCYLTILAVFNCLLVTLIKLVTQLA